MAVAIEEKLELKQCIMLDGLRCMVGKWRVSYDSFLTNKEYLPDEDDVPGEWRIEIKTPRPILGVLPNTEHEFGWWYREGVATGRAVVSKIRKDSKGVYYYTGYGYTLPVMAEVVYMFKWNLNAAIFHVARIGVQEHGGQLVLTCLTERAKGIPPAPGTDGELSRVRPDEVLGKMRVISEEYSDDVVKYTFRKIE